MTKSDLIKSVSKSAGITQDKADLAVRVVFDSMASALSNGEEVSIYAFGLFHVGDTPARTILNLQTGEPLDIPAGKRIKFKSSRSLLDMVK